jgi:hypothetical protein
VRATAAAISTSCSEVATDAYCSGGGTQLLHLIPQLRVVRVEP